MAFLLDDTAVGGQLFVGAGSPIALGIGEAKVRGSAFVEGPQITGNATEFPQIIGSLMVAPSENEDSVVLPIPGAICGVNNSPYSLVISGDAAVFDNLDVASNINVGNDIKAQGEVMSRCGAHILSAKKNFDIQHPSKEGWRLRHTCPEAPTNDVYIRGKVVNKNEIDLPAYWKDFVDIQSITVSLTPIGAHQDVIVKRIDEDKVYLQTRSGIPINCFYHIFAERKDGEKLIPEYPGKTPDDYPGNNDEYSVVGWNYDVRNK
jgi:hypothetical protein